MIKGKVFFIGLLIIFLFEGLYGQDTYFPQCKRYKQSEYLDNQLIEYLYSRASEYVNNADIEGLELTALQMKSLSCQDYPIYDGLLQNLEGVIYYFKGENSKALKYFLESLAIYSELEYYRGVNGLLNNVAIIFALVGDYQSSKKYLLRAIEINEREGMNYYDIFSYNLAEVEAELGNYEESINILKGLIKNEFAPLNLVSPVSVIAMIISGYNKLGMPEEAESWINRGYLALDEEDFNDVDRISFYTSVMEYHLNNGDYDKVISTSKQYNIDERHRLPDQYDHLEYLCRAYAATGNYSKAWNYDNLLSEIYARNNILDREEIINLLMVEYEETRNQRLQETINREMQLNSNRQDLSYKLTIISFTILFALIILFVILLRIRKIRNKYKEEFSIETEKFA
ncbi:MAG: tetratricopeptide repeat protein, partial [Bacteroidota bacterium]